MKKIVSVLMVAVAMMMAVPAQAQLIKFGVRGGMNFSELDFNKKSFNDATDSSTGFFIGPMAEITIPIIGLGLDGAVMFSQKNAEIGGEKAKQQGIEIPVNLKYTIGLGSFLGIYLAAGPDFFFNFKDIDIENLKAKKTQVALNLGAGVKLLRKLQVGINYQIPMGDSFKLKNLDDKTIGETKTWQVSLAYIF